MALVTTVSFDIGEGGKGGALTQVQTQIICFFGPCSAKGQLFSLAGANDRDVSIEHYGW